jgi:hypothetical protein
MFLEIALTAAAYHFLRRRKKAAGRLLALD